MAELHSPFAPLTVCPNVPCSVDSGTERAGEEGGAAVPKRKQLLRREGTEMQTRPGTWEVAGRRGEEGPPRELIGGRGRGRSLAGRLQRLRFVSISARRWGPKSRVETLGPYLGAPAGQFVEK